MFTNPYMLIGGAMVAIALGCAIVGAVTIALIIGIPGVLLIFLGLIKE